MQKGAAQYVTGEMPFKPGSLTRGQVLLSRPETGAGDVALSGVDEATQTLTEVRVLEVGGQEPELHIALCTLLSV